MANNILVFVPAYGQQVSVATLLSTHALTGALNQKSIGGGISALSFPDIAELRGMALTIWYDTMPTSTHMLFVDNDMGFSPDLVIDMLLLDEPLVGAIYRQRKEPVSWAGSGTGEPLTERRGNFMQVEGVGFGVTLVRRDCVARMLEAYPNLIDTRLHLHPAGDTIRAAGANRILRFFEKLDLPERGLVSEDLSFCIRWRKAGGQVWASIGHRISHVGPYDYNGRYLDTVEQAQKDGQIHALPENLGGAPLGPLGMDLEIPEPSDVGAAQASIPLPPELMPALDMATMTAGSPNGGGMMGMPT